MGIQRAAEDPWVKEMAKHEARPVMIGGRNGTYVEPIPFSEGGKGGMPFFEFPKAMYRAESALGGPRISAMKQVGNESEELLAHGQGWRAKQEDAIDLVHANALEVAKLAANRVHNERWMSEGARAEAAAADEATMEHLPSVPVTPIRKPGSGKS